MLRKLTHTTIAILMLLSLSFPSYAKLSCTLHYGRGLIHELFDLFGDRVSDKFKHCTISCQLALRCPDIEVAAVGVFKEVYDLFTPGNAELEDIKADLIGIECADVADSDEECIDLCDVKYPN